MLMLKYHDIGETREIYFQFCVIFCCCQLVFDLDVKQRFWQPLAEKDCQFQIIGLLRQISEHRPYMYLSRKLLIQFILFISKITSIAPDDSLIYTLILGANDQYLLYSRVPKCGSETTLALMTNVSIANNVTMEVHQNRKYFEHQWFKPDSSSVRFPWEFSCLDMYMSN